MDREFDTRSSVTARQYLAIGFAALSVRIDNNTNQWLYVSDPGVYISPYTIGAVYPLGGSTTADFQFTAKPGTSQAAIITGEYAVITYYDFDQPASAGQTTVVRAPSTEWRNPKTLVFLASAEVAGAGVSGFVTDFTYTVPAGRRARVDIAQSVAEVVVSDGTGVRVAIEAAIGVFPLGGVGNAYSDAFIYNGTVVGARADTLIPASKELQATDVILGMHRNQRGAGVTALLYEAATLTEGDA